MRTLKKSIAFILVFTLMMVVAILPASAASEYGVINGVWVNDYNIAGYNDGEFTIHIDTEVAVAYYEVEVNYWGSNLIPGERPVYVDTLDYNTILVSFNPGTFAPGFLYWMTITAFDSNCTWLDTVDAPLYMWYNSNEPIDICDETWG